MSTTRHVNLANYSKGDYDPGPLLKRCLWMAASRCFLETSVPWPSALKAQLLRLFGAEIGESVVFKPHIKIKYPWFLTIGEQSWIGEHAWLDNVTPIEIGHDVVISQGALLLTGNHDYTSPEFDLMPGPIVLKDGSWISAKAIVCPGVTVGESSVLLSGAVATSDLESSAIYRGNPAAKVRERKIKES